MSPIWAPKQDTKLQSTCPSKRKRPRLRGALGSQRAAVRLRFGAEPELAALGLAAAGLALLGLQVARCCGIQSGRSRLAAGTGPVSLVGHGGDHLLAVHGLAGFAEHARGGVQGAGLLGLGLLGFGLLGFGLLGFGLLGFGLG